MSKNKKRKIKLSFSGLLLNIILLALVIVLLYLINTFNIIPVNYAHLIVSFLIISTIILNILVIFKYKNKFLKVMKIISIILTIIFSIGYSFLIYYLNKTMNLFDSIAVLKEEVTYYYIMVLDSSKYNDVSDLYKKKLAYYENTDKEVIDKIKLDMDYHIENDYTLLKNLLYEEKVEAILISDIIKNKYEEDDTEFKKNIRILQTIEIKKDIPDITKKVSIKNTPFNILISGIDTYGDIGTTSRNDVNIVATVNPLTNKILLTSIPRDYYVKLHGTTGYNDKLTHASYYGTNMAVQTIEDILDIDINYYVKVNFTTVLDLVDKIGGVDVYSDQALHFCNIKKGMNHLDGSCALAFSRERHSYSDGDRHRGRNQQAVITAIFEKLTNGYTLVTQYTDILEALDGKFATNIPMNEITSFIKYKLNEMDMFKLESIQVDGSGAMGKTYSYPNQDLWIMIPDQNTINNAHDKIISLMEEE